MLCLPSLDAVAQASRQAIRQRIGYDGAQQRLGRAMPTGAGIAFAHVEGNAGEYAPKLEGPNFDAVAFSLRSGPSEPSAHATSTARVIYGNAGLAPGVEVVHCMTTADFLGSGYLMAGTSAPPVAEDPTPFPPRVFTHSWIGDPSDPRHAAMVLRRADHQIDTRDVIMCVGVNNGRDSAVPSLMGSGYNVIAVGTTNGESSGGYTKVEVEGRAKPDLVAPNGMTSFTTPVVAACAGLLLQQADQLVEQGHAGANRSEVIKAALMGGAVKSAAWQAEAGKPLDAHLGAGEVNIDRSLRILSGAALEPGGQLRRLFGWAYPTLAPGGTAAFELELPVESGAVSFTAVWNRRIDGRTAVIQQRDSDQKLGVWLDAPRLADVDLRLVSLEDGSRRLLAESASRIDNVELVHLPSLKAGRYRIELTREAESNPATADEDWEVALTWAIDKPRPPEVPDEAGGIHETADERG